ncbi:uncharacterized protein LOC134820993 [Bolinopsis microptera]|uniref:uncharacterized protein LOC134820993 n=1 Tax=Bolinopsis microptera TaxID=2820187 RepID=UPI00307AE891
MSLIGLVICVWVIYCIIFFVIRLHGTQNMFVINVLFYDTIVAIIGFIRGLGIINKMFVGVNTDGQENYFCFVFSLVGQLFWNSPMTVLMPLTIDRVLVIMFPFMHRKWMSHKIIFLMIGLWWFPSLSFTLYHLVQYQRGLAKISYQPEYHRCTFDHQSTGQMEAIILYFVPIITLVAVYTVLLVQVIRMNIKFRKLLLTSLSICASGVLIAIPQTLLYMNVHMEYKEAQFFTVTLFYISPLCDSVIYYCTNPRVMENLSQTEIVKAASRFSRVIIPSNFSRGLSGD